MSGSFVLSPSRALLMKISVRSMRFPHTDSLIRCFRCTRDIKVPQLGYGVPREMKAEAANVPSLQDGLQNSAPGGSVAGTRGVGVPKRQ